MSAWDRFDDFVSRAIYVILGLLALFALLVVFAMIVVGSFHLLDELS